MVYNPSQKKKSDFITDDAVTNASTFDYVKAGVNKKTTWSNLISLFQAQFGLGMRVYETESAMVADSALSVDDYAIVEENYFAVYKVTNIVASTGDVTLSSGLTASQEGKAVDYYYTTYSQLRGLKSNSFKDGELVNLGAEGIGDFFIVSSGVVTDDDANNIVFNDNGSRYLKRFNAKQSMHQVVAKMYRGDTVNIACYGDSRTDGNGSTGWTANPTDGNGDALGASGSAHTPSKAFPTFFQSWLREYYDNNNINVFNAGYSGKPMYKGDDPADDNWANRNYENAIENNPDYGEHEVVFIGFGTNDTRIVADNSAGFVTEYRKLIRTIISKGRIPVIVGLDYFYRYPPDHNHIEANEQYNALCRQIAEEFDLTFLDLHSETRYMMQQQTDYLGLGNLAPDLLHSGDGGQAYRAAMHMMSLTKSIIVVDNEPVPIPHSDAAARFRFDESNNTIDDEGTSKFDIRWKLFSSSYSAGDPVMEIWCFVRGRSSELIWRSFANSDIDNSVSAANRPKVTVKSAIKSGDWNSPVLLSSGELPGTGVSVLSTSGKREIDRPYRIIRLLPGFNKITLEAPNGVDMTGGYFEINPKWRDLRDGNRNELPRSHESSYIQTNALKVTGPMFYFEENLPSGTPQNLHKFMVREESKDGSDVISVGRDGESCEIWMDLEFVTNETSILIGAGKHANSTTTDPVGGALMLFVNSSGQPSLGYFEDGTNTTLVSATPWSVPGATQKVVIKITRSTDTYTVDVYDVWSTAGAALLSYDSSANSFKIGGVCGLAPIPGVYFPPGSAANTTREVRIYSAIIKHKVI